MEDPTTKDGRVAIKMDDAKYLRSHPELRWLIDRFMEVRTSPPPCVPPADARVGTLGELVRARCRVSC